MRRRELIAVAAVAAVVRAVGLGSQSYWYDESFTVRLLREDLGGLLSGVRDTESTPPLYYLLAWGWAQLAGDGEAAVRALSVLCGVATVVIAAVVADRLWGRRAGLAAAAVLALNPLLVWYSQEARSYALLVLLCTISLACFLRALEAPSRRVLAGWAVASALALATHYFAVFALAAEAAMLLAMLGRRALAPVGGVALTGAALLPLALEQRSQNAFLAVGDDDLLHRAGAIPKQFLLGATAAQIDAPHVVAAAALVGLLAAAAILTLRFRDRVNRGLLAVIAAVVLAPIALALAGLDYVNPRNAIFAVVPPALLLGASVSPRGPSLLCHAAVAALCALGLGVVVAVQRDDFLQRDDWRSAAAAIEGPAAVVIAPGGRIPLTLYEPGLRPLGEDDRVLTVYAVTLTRPGRSPARAPEGFAQTADRVTDTYLLQRFQARSPWPVDPAALYAGGEIEAGFVP